MILIENHCLFSLRYMDVDRDIQNLECVIIVHIRGESLGLSIYILKSYTRNTNSMLRHSASTIRLESLIPTA